ncbi:MAG: hypothetical protein AMJ93_08620 [Anaerolineae bacterium SM23_84]|nr:MAG: hypothetical protein AMJ93_08620 [Anaerolineae bacterium SM23_84]
MNWLDFLRQYGGWIATGVLVLWYFWDHHRQGKLGDALRKALAALINLAKEYGRQIPEEKVKEIAGKIYDADDLLNLPTWADLLLGILKEALFGTREEFQQKVWDEWQKFLADEQAVLDAGIV